jgi:benzylsuccinate CoA-transferase BbsF subunit
VAWAYIYLHNPRPGSMKRIGLGYEELRKVKQDVILMDVSIVGQEGPLAGVGGWGNNSMGQSGQYYYFRNPGDEPLVSGFTATADCITPIFAAMTGIFALDYKNRTGKGQHIDLCQLEVMIHFIGPAVLGYTANGKIQAPVGNRSPYAAPHNAYRCKGKDEWCVIAVFNDEEWKNLCAVMGDPDWARDDKFTDTAARKENEDQLDRLIGSWTRNHTPQEVMGMLQAAGVPSGMVQNAEDIVAGNPQVEARGLLPNRPHPVMGNFLHARWPFIMSKTPDVIKTSPLLGEHNYEVCTDILGMTNEEFAALIDAGVIV